MASHSDTRRARRPPAAGDEVSGAEPAHDAARAVVGPFKNVFTISQPKTAIAVNWGIAALLYAVIAGLLARLIARAALLGVPPAETVV